MKRFWGLIFVLIGASGCASPTLDIASVEDLRLQIKEETRVQRIAIVRNAFEQQRRLNRISYRLGKAAGELCRGREVNQLGAYFSDWDERASEWLELAIEATHINLHEHGIEVVDVLEGSAAGRAGLKVGDHVIRIDGTPLPRGRGAMRVFRKRIERLRSASDGKLELTVRREATFRTLTVTAEKSCEFPAVLTVDRSLNAATDGEVIYFNRGLVRFAKSDDEIAAVLAHEMAHITMGHLEAKRQNIATGAAVGLIVDIFLGGVVPLYGLARVGVFSELGARIGAVQWSPEFESEADYLSMYLIARAGYDIASPPNLWKRMSVEQPDATEEKFLASHPTAPKRFVQLESAAREIGEKIKRGKPLVPNSLTARFGR